ncbi:MAG TPA: hypothetical protein VG797_03640 [Phycisphaerales bacterium]|nr:hypothetical protein [Phycisphaerales bacterium]
MRFNRTSLLPAIVMFAACVSSAVAQNVPPPTSPTAPATTPSADPQDVRPPAPGETENPMYPAVYLIGLALAVVAVGVTIMPSKRTHQD